MVNFCAFLAFASLLVSCGPAASRAGPAPREVASPSPPGAGPAVRATEVDFALPQRLGRVSDHADLLSPEQEAQLDQRYAALQQELGCEMALLTIQALSGVSIEEYSLGVANGWELGREGFDDGLLITLAYDNKMARIEVGYGLELVISDELAKEVIDDMTREFSVGRFFGGIEQGSTQLIQLIHTNAALIGKRKR
jgi:uncharacterized protein